MKQREISIISLPPPKGLAGGGESHRLRPSQALQRRPTGLGKQGNRSRGVVVVTFFLAGGRWESGAVLLPSAGCRWKSGHRCPGTILGSHEALGQELRLDNQEQRSQRLCRRHLLADKKEGGEKTTTQRRAGLRWFVLLGTRRRIQKTLAPCAPRCRPAAPLRSLSPACCAAQVSSFGRLMVAGRENQRKGSGTFPATCAWLGRKPN